MREVEVKPEYDFKYGNFKVGVFNDMSDKMYQIFYDKMLELTRDCEILVKKDISHFTFIPEPPAGSVASYRDYGDYYIGITSQKWLKNIKDDENFETIIKSDFIKKYGYDPYPLVGNKSHLIICNGFERKIKIKNLLK